MLVLVFSTLASAEVSPPNYDFSTDTLAEFFPGQDAAGLETKYGKGEVLRDDGSIKMVRFMVAQIRYVFPVVVQIAGGKIIDMHARLPSYFLHDVFHHSLIKRWGPQQHYMRVDEEAYYEWKNEERVMSYGASCTITCFPMYLSVRPGQVPGGFKSIAEFLDTRTARN